MKFPSLYARLVKQSQPLAKVFGYPSDNFQARVMEDIESIYPDGLIQLRESSNRSRSPISLAKAIREFWIGFMERKRASVLQGAMESIGLSVDLLAVRSDSEKVIDEQWKNELRSEIAVTFTGGKIKELVEGRK